MVTYATRADFLRLGRENLALNIAKQRSAESRNPSGLTFLSHSSKDDELMPGVIMILEGHGATVYLDKKDGTLQSKTPQDIASTLRSRIQVARKFIVFATDHIKSSSWVPWELGLADGYRSLSNVCILPALDYWWNSEWTHQEYLGIYDRIVWGNFANMEHEWLVHNSRDNTAIKLREWLSR